MNGSGPSVGKDNSDGFGEVFYGVMGGALWVTFSVAVIDQYRLAASGVSGIDIAPAVANHPALGEVKMECFGRVVQHAGRGLTEFGGRVRVAWLITNLDVRDFRNKF